MPHAALWSLATVAYWGALVFVYGSVVGLPLLWFVWIRRVLKSNREME
jgi:hypothetical protein